MVLAIGLGAQGCSSRTTILSPAPVPTPVGIVGLSAPKELLSGLLDMQSISWHNTDAGQPTFVIGNVAMFPALFGGIVINATWSQMQTAAGAAVDFSAVDAALAQVRTYNAAWAGAPLGVKLRIYGGNSAPQWAKNLPGGPITIYRNPAGCRNMIDTCPLTIGPFWTAPYIAAWRAFQAAVAAKYDVEPLIRAVAVTSCASQTDEPFVPTTGPIAKTNLRTAGYTDTAEQACLSGALTDYAAWTQTGIDFTFNTYTNFGSAGTNSTFTIGVMNACRSRTQGVGGRCILDNHALQTPIYGADAPIYTAIGAAGGPTNFQTQSPVGMGCLWTDTIAQGVALHARAIEIWPDTNDEGFDTLTTAQVAALASEFTTPIPVTVETPSCPGFQ